MSTNLERKKYIGGEFSTADFRSASSAVPSSTISHFFPPAVNGLERSLFESGADSIAFILSGIKHKTLNIWVPENFCFESLHRVQEKLPEKNLIIRRYPLIETISFSSDSQNILLLAYFNRYDEQFFDLARELKNNFVTIEDFTHAPLDIGKTRADFSFCSLRKFVPVSVSVTYSIQTVSQSPDTFESAYLRLKRTGAEIKELVSIEPGFADESVYLTLFKLAESQLRTSKIQSAHRSQIDAFNAIEFDKILQIRKNNYQVLHNELERLKLAEILPGKYMYLMIATDYQKQMRKYLFDHHIFPAIHWSDSDSPISKKVLSFHIDHRYNHNDMGRIGDVLKAFRE